MRKTLIVGLFLLFVTLQIYGQSSPLKTGEQVITFRFVPGQDMFFIPYGGNNTELDRLFSLVEEYRAEITAGQIPMYVDGYCSSGDNAKAGFQIAVTRSNRVKSELITNKGLLEEHFITKNYASAYTSPDGKNYRDMVVVTLHIPAKVVEPQQEVKPESEPIAQQKPEPQPIVKERPEPEPEPRQVIVPEPAVPSKPYNFAVRTNLLYDAFLTPTIGIEWRLNPDIGIKVDGSVAHWGNEKGKVQKIWLVSPEVRWYLSGNKRLYVGAGANIGEYNIYKGMLGGIISDDTGYQGKLYGGGVTVGYQLCLSRSFSLDFNLGMGYTHLKYDLFTISNETRVFKDRDKTKNFWGPTQAGISLIWTIGGSK